MLVRSWNLFHGNSVPPQRRAYLDEMIRLATADAPEVVCFQEVPAWALGSFTVGDVAAHPLFGAEFGRRLTSLNEGLLRSAFSGQGNAIAVAPSLEVLDHRVETLNTRAFRGEQARELGLGRHARLKWAKERRIVQTVRIERPDGQTLLLANTHCTSYRTDERIADVELRRAASFAVSVAAPDEPVVLAGDFNARPGSSRTLAELSSAEWGFSQPGPGIDHVLVRGAPSSSLRVWPPEQRTVDGVLLSDHSPVEVDVE